jgi:hypothetical protein
LALCAALPEYQRNQSGEAARIGTATHGLIERVLREGAEPEAYRDRIIELVGDDEEVSFLRAGAAVPGVGRVFYIVDSDMINGANVMVRYVRKRCKKLGVDPKDLQLETRTNPLPERDDTSGTADVTIDAWPTELEVVDYKNGVNYVEHKNNGQLLAYLLGKALESKFAHERYRVTVVQPNLSNPDLAKPRSFEIDKKGLRAFQKRHRAAVERCDEAERDKNAPKDHHEINAKWAKKYLVAGDHCMFCDARAVCPAYRAMAQKQAALDFDDPPEELESPKDEIEAARILEWAPHVEALIRAATTFAQRALERGHRVPGFKLVRKRAVRTWTTRYDTALIVKHILKNKFIKNEQLLYTKPTLISGPQAEKLVDRKRREEFADLFLDTPEGGLTLAAENDPRPAAPAGPAADFDDDEEDFG